MPTETTLYPVIRLRPADKNLPSGAPRRGAAFYPGDPRQQRRATDDRAGSQRWLVGGARGIAVEQGGQVPIGAVEVGGVEQIDAINPFAPSHPGLIALVTGKIEGRFSGGIGQATVEHAILLHPTLGGGHKFRDNNLIIVGQCHPRFNATGLDRQRGGSGLIRRAIDGAPISNKPTTWEIDRGCSLYIWGRKGKGEAE